MNKKTIGFMRVLALCIILVLALTACSDKAPADATTQPKDEPAVDSIYVEHVDGTDRHALQSGQYLASGTNTPVDTMPTEGYAHYKDGILYLNNYVNETASFVFGSDSLTVRLTGQNALSTISDNYGGYIAALQSAGGSLVFEADDGAALVLTPGADGAVSILVKGTVQVNSGDVTVKARNADNRPVSCEKLLLGNGCFALVSKAENFANLETWNGSTPTTDYTCLLFSDDTLPEGPALVNVGGVWCYVEGGQLSAKTTIVKYKGKWFYVTGGIWVKDTTLVKYNNTWFYVKNGIVNKENTLCKFNGKWYHVDGGKWVKDTTLVKYGSSWCYVKGGIMNMDNTLCKFNGKWYHVNGGKWVKDTTLVQYGSSWLYVKDGLVDFTYSGTFEYKGETYTITEGIRE